MKRMLSLFLCVLLLSVCTACSSKESTSENAENILDSSKNIVSSVTNEAASSNSSISDETDVATKGTEAKPETTVNNDDQSFDDKAENVQKPAGTEQPKITESNDNQSHDDKTESTQETVSKPSEQSSANTEEQEEKTEMKLYVQVGEKTFSATLESNSAVDAFVTMMQEAPVVIQMSDYAGFEKVGSLGTSLPASNTQTTTNAGDIVLYNGNQIVIFYGSNSWSYTRLGHIDDLSGWEEALGSGDVTVTFSIGE